MEIELGVLLQELSLVEGGSVCVDDDGIAGILARICLQLRLRTSIYASILMSFTRKPSARNICWIVMTSG